MGTECAREGERVGTGGHVPAQGHEPRAAPGVGTDADEGKSDADRGESSGEFSSTRCTASRRLSMSGEREPLHGSPHLPTKAAESARSKPVAYYGVYSDAVGMSGVYQDWDEVANVVESDAAVAEHASAKRCDTYESALEYVREETRRQAESTTREKSIKGSLIQRAHTKEKLAPSRMEMISTCLGDFCGLSKCDGSATLCRGGCYRSLHVEVCAQMGKGYAALGNFTCPECRLAKIMDRPEEASERLREVVSRTMVLELGQGKETTAASYAEYTRLEELYVQGMGQVLDGGGLKLPRHSPEAFKNFCTWMVINEERARSLESTVRSAGAMMTKLKVVDVTKAPEVKAHIKDLLQSVDMLSEPATTATPAMLKLIVDELLDKRFSSPLVASRTRLQFLIEGVGGCRIGEVVGGGEGHGLLANNTCILEDLSEEVGKPGRVVVEAHIEHSKTGFARHLDMAGTTATSGLEVASAMKDYWRLAGFDLVTSTQSGVKVTRPDFWVVRVSLLGLNDVKMRQLEAVLKRINLQSVKPYVASTVQSLHARHAAQGQSKKYVNVARGSSKSGGLDEVVELLRAEGFGATKVPGPLLLATTGGKRPTWKIMPLALSSSFEHAKEMLTRAYEDLNPGGITTDRDLDLPHGKVPQWSTHSLRRLADTTAQRYRETTGVTEAQIDIYFGWHEKVLLKAMQTHYASMNIRERMKTANITGMM